MNDDKRIRQFEQMVAADRQNELGHFSLGKAYLDAGRFDDAAESLARVIEINPRMSKAFQLLAEAHEKNGHRQAAIEVMTRGVTIADEQGDRLPRDAMAGLLREWAAPVPPFRQEKSAADSEVGSGASVDGFKCGRCGRPRGQLPKPPFKGPLGEQVFAHICKSCWQDWISMGTKVINELGLELSTSKGQDTYDQYMIEFLQLDQG